MESLGVDQVTKGLGRLFRIRRNVAIHDARLSRAVRDHGEWVVERDRILDKRLTDINNDFEVRGVFRSGMRLASRRDAKAEALRELRRKRALLADLREDIVHEETLLERLYRKIRKRPLSAVSAGTIEARVEADWRSAEVDPSGSPSLEIPE